MILLFKETLTPKSFINVSDFNSHEEAIEYIIELDRNEDKYLQMAAEPWLPNNKVNGEFLDESVLDFFDFILEDSKRKKAVARSFYLAYSSRMNSLKHTISFSKRSLLEFFKKKA